MIVVQRVRIRWGSNARGAAEAARRRDVPTVLPLPPLPEDAALVVHDVLADEECGYRPSAGLYEPDDASGVRLRVRWRDGDLVVRRNPLTVAYPRGPLRAGKHLFTLAPGQVGRHQLNLRNTGCQCSPVWYYEHWVLHVTHTPDGIGAPGSDVFLSHRPDVELDDRVHLYGGAARRSRVYAARVSGR